MDANAWKTKGNEAFSAKRFDEAIDAFSQAITLDPTNHVLYSNRSASYASTHKFDEALTDAQKCVELNPSWGKGYVRLGAALHGCGKLEDAVTAYNNGLKVEPGNTALTQGLEAVNKDMAAAEEDEDEDDVKVAEAGSDAAGAFGGGAKENPFAKVFGPQTIGKILSNPRLAPYMSQPDYVQIINTLCKQPNLVQGFMKDQRIMMTMLELMNINTADMGGKDAPAPSAPTAPAAAAPKPAAKPAAPAPAALSPAEKLKQEGNQLYKERHFEEAYAKYHEASQLEPKNSIYLLNKTAVIFEQGKYEECIVECDAVVEHCREHNSSDFATMVKAMTRKGSCLQKQLKYDEAIACFKKALLEHRNPDTLGKLDVCEKEKKEYERVQYLSPELSLKAKEEGNAFFKQDKFPEAVKCYEEAIKRNPKDHTIYSNRAAALLKLGAYEDAIKDCDACLAIQPLFVKAFARKGAAYFFTKQYHKAMTAYAEGMKIDPNHEECKEGHQRTQMKILEQANSDEVDETASRRAMADPEIAAIMNDSYMRLVLDEMNKDPKKIQDYMRDPGISEKLNKLIQAGVLRFGSGKPPAPGGKTAGRR